MNTKEELEEDFDDSPINTDKNVEFPEFDLKSQIIKKTRSKLGASMLDSIEMLLRNSLLINGKSFEGTAVPFELEERLSQILKEPELKNPSKLRKSESDIINDLSALQELMMSRKLSFNKDPNVNESAILESTILNQGFIDYGKETDTNEYIALIEKILDGIEEDKSTRKFVENEKTLNRDSIILGESYNFKAKDKK